MRYGDLVRLTPQEPEVATKESAYFGQVPVTIEGKTLFYVDASVAATLRHAASSFVGYLVQVDTEMPRPVERPLMHGVGGQVVNLLCRSPAEVAMNMRIKFVERQDVQDKTPKTAEEIQTIFGHWNRG